MYAGLIPGVNIKTRPRVLLIYVYMSLNEEYFKINAAIASHIRTDPKDMRDILKEYAIPPFSPERIMKEETEKMKQLLRKMAPLKGNKK